MLRAVRHILPVCRPSKAIGSTTHLDRPEASGLMARAKILHPLTGEGASPPLFVLKMRDFESGRGKEGGATLTRVKIVSHVC